MTRRRDQLRGVAATALLLLLLAGLPAVLIGIGLAPWDADFSELRILLTSPDDGTLAMTVIAGVAWSAWAILTVSVVVEVVAFTRGLPAPSLPALGVPQRAAGQLVAVAALLFSATPAAINGVPGAPVHATAAAPLPDTPSTPGTRQHDASTPVRPATPVPERSVAPVLNGSPVLGPSPAPVPTNARHPAHVAAPAPGREPVVRYTVKRGDSLWRIAERLLGDGTRYTEIVTLNREVLDGRPGFILPGTVLKIPQPTGAPQERRSLDEQYVVQPGDTLSQIAQEELGDPMRYPDIYEASRTSPQPDGARLSDPDLIRPGWQLTIPGNTEPDHDSPAPEKPADRPKQRPSPAPDGETPSPTINPEPSDDPTPAETSQASPDTNAGDDTNTPTWLAPGLTGAGALLAGGIFLAVRAHRRTQLRYRRPGQIVAAPPPDLRNIEKTTLVTGAPLEDCIGTLDRALDHLATQREAQGQEPPALIEVVLGRDTLTLHLDGPDDLPSPWQGTGAEWTIRLDEQLPEVAGVWPYPLLTTIGQDDKGRLHLLNLEHYRVVSLTGDAEGATALARHIAAELSVNPWSVLVDVHVVGMSQELADLDPLRLQHDEPGSRALAHLAAELNEAKDSGRAFADEVYAVITASNSEASQFADVLLAATRPLAAALITLTPTPGSVVVEVTQDGRLRIPSLDLDLTSAGLTREEAAACAALVDLTRESPTVATPSFTQAADGWRSLVDQGGALRAEFTARRRDDDQERDDSSTLPNKPEEYTRAAAAAESDVEALAPAIPSRTRRIVEDADPTLDDDLHAWFNADCPLPRLVLLGPVTAEVPREPLKPIAKRKPYFVELLSYLALAPHGRTGGAVADAFSISPSRMRTDLGHLREWLGTSPRSGRLHLPAATESRTYVTSGVKAYQLEDVLVDVDLFRRLRARGQARGPDGIADLIAALRLVQGLPFDHLRERGWSWLLDEDRLHETIGCAIVDTAHVVVMDAMTREDLGTARAAAETACRAAPYDDICWLDLIAVIKAEGHDDAAYQMLGDDVLNRSDDLLGPIDLPARTREVIEQHPGWIEKRRLRVVKGDPAPATAEPLPRTPSEPND